MWKNFKCFKFTMQYHQLTNAHLEFIVTISKPLKIPPFLHLLEHMRISYILSYFIQTWSVVNTVALQVPVFNFKTSPPKTTTTSWRSGLGLSTALLWLDSLQARWFHPYCWAPPTWPSSTSTVTIPRIGQGSRWTIKVRWLRCSSLCVCLCVLADDWKQQRP